MVIIEAMACGCPSVATQTGGFEENIQNERTGLLVPVGDAPALSQAVCRILKDEVLRKSLVTAGLQHVKNNFDISKNCEKSIDDRIVQK